MTSWRSVTHMFFLVSLSIFHLSKQEEFCKTHYFSMKELRKHLFPNKDLPDIMPCVETKDPKDMVECTVERAYLQNQSSMELKYLLQCIINNSVGDDYSGSEKCQGDLSKYITYFNFMCLVAKAVNAPPEELEDQGCGKELFCPVSPTVRLLTTATTTVQPTTTPERTTAHPTEMRPPTLQPLTATTKTTTGAAATLSQIPTTPSNGKKDKIESDKPDNSPAQVGLLTIIVLSLCINVVLVVYICKSHRGRQYGLQPSSGTNDQPSSTPLPSVNGESVETVLLHSPYIQPSDGHPV